jgi:hypothetical protein
LETAVSLASETSFVTFKTLVVDSGESNGAFRDAGVFMENERLIAVETSRLVSITFVTGTLSTLDALSVGGSEVLGAFFNASSSEVEEVALALKASGLVGAF